MKIESAPVSEEQKIRAKNCLLTIDEEIPEEEVLCHMDYHFLNVMYANEKIWIIDWNTAVNAKPIWDYARSYVIFYEYAAGMKTRFLKAALSKGEYSKENFMKAVYVSAINRLNEYDTKRVRQLITVTENMME